MSKSTTIYHTHTHNTLQEHCSMVCVVLSFLVCSGGLPSVLGLCSVVVAVSSGGCVWRVPPTGRGYWRRQNETRGRQAWRDGGRMEGCGETGLSARDKLTGQSDLEDKIELLKLGD